MFTKSFKHLGERLGEELRSVDGRGTQALPGKGSQEQNMHFPASANRFNALSVKIEIISSGWWWSY